MTKLPHESEDLKIIDTHFQASLDATVDEIVVIAENDEIELVNEATEKIFGYEAQELIGRNVSCLMPEPETSRHDRYIFNFLHTNTSRDRYHVQGSRWRF